MHKHLPHAVEPLRMAAQRRQLRGELELARMSRLTTELESSDGAVQVELEFGSDERRRPCVEGRASVQVRLICQRCLEPMPLQLDADIRLGLVHSESESVELSPGFEPLVVTDGPMVLADIVEDELLLALPGVPMHPERQCRPGPFSVGEEEQVAAQRDNPFAVLAGLKDREK